MIYATSDLHGCSLKNFTALLKKAKFSKNDELYVLGDVIDRGEEGIKLLSWMRKQKNIRLIMGNHEQMMLNCRFLFDGKPGEIDEKIKNLSDGNIMTFSHWLKNGGNTTLAAIRKIKKRELDQIIEYIANAPLFIELDAGGKSFVLVHSGIGNFNSGKPMSAYTDFELLWTRPDANEKYFSNRITVFGHTPTQYYGQKHTGRAFFTDTWINIDTGAAAGLSPMLLRLDDLKTFYVQDV